MLLEKDQSSPFRLGVLNILAQGKEIDLGKPITRVWEFTIKYYSSELKAPLSLEREEKDREPLQKEAFPRVPSLFNA